MFLFWDLGLRFWQKSGRIRENIQREILRNMCVLCNMTTYYVIMTSHHGCQQILIGVFDFMIKSEIFSNCWILMPGIISTIVDLTHVTWIIVTSIHWLELKQIMSNCFHNLSRDSGTFLWQAKLTFPDLTDRVYKKQAISICSFLILSESLSALSEARCQCCWHCQHFLRIQKNSIKFPVSF